MKDKLETIQKLTRPEMVNDVNWCLGLMAYYRKIIPFCLDISRQLTHLTQIMCNSFGKIIIGITDLLKRVPTKACYMDLS